MTSTSIKTNNITTTTTNTNINFDNHNKNNNNNNNDINLSNEPINEGFEHWKKINQRWRQNISSNPNGVVNKYKSVDAVTVTEEFLNKGGVFSKRVPLPDLVAILAEEWENEEN